METRLVTVQRRHHDAPPPKRISGHFLDGPQAAPCCGLRVRVTHPELPQLEPVTRTLLCFAFIAFSSETHIYSSHSNPGRQAIEACTLCLASWCFALVPSHFQVKVVKPTHNVFIQQQATFANTKFAVRKALAARLFKLHHDALSWHWHWSGR